MYVLSGDHSVPTQRLASDLGIDHCVAEVLPADKAAMIGGLQRQDHSVCHVGDGLNDAVSLRKADVSVSLKGASILSQDSAQVVPLNGDLSSLVGLFELQDGFSKAWSSMVVASNVPAAIIVFGAFFLHFQLVHSVIFNQVGFGTGLYDAVSVPGTLPDKRSGRPSGVIAA